MTIRKQYYLSTFLFFYTFTAIAQAGLIKGTLKGNSNLSGITVSLMLSKDSSIIKASLCNNDGSFEFERIKQGSYYISINALGYEKYTGNSIQIDATQSLVQLQPIILLPITNNIGNVTVNSRKPFVERRIDKVVINPDALITNAGSTTLEVLEKSPGVLVDVDGNISLKGKSGVIVFIDDKPSYLSAADLASYLRSLPSGNIESIEIMTNPPAKYDASGNAGIINIKLKRNKTIGFNGGFNVSYGQGRYHRTNNSANFNYRINKLNFFSNISFNQVHSYQDLTITRYYYAVDGSYNSGFKQNSYLKKELQSSTARVGLDYYMNKQTTVGIVLSGFINPSFAPVSNNAIVSDKAGQAVSLVQANNPITKKWKNGSININYTHKLPKGRELTANADYIHYDATQSQFLVNNIFNPSNILTSSSTLQSLLPAALNIQSIKIDYSHPFTNGAKFDAGLKSSWVSTDNTADFFDVINNTASPNYTFSNRFTYKENVNAAYLNYAKDWKNISIQLGLRGENTNINGYQFGNPTIKDSSFNLHYTNLFPTLYVAYRLDTIGKHQLGFSFGRRINRPNYQDMNPFTYPLDRYTYYGGNPFLQPTLSYNVELSHTYKNIITTTLDFSVTKNLISETNEQRGTVYYSRPGNFGEQIAYGLSVNAGLPLTKWWMLQLYTEVKNLAFKSDIYGQVLDESRFYWYFGPTNQFTLTKNLSMELGGSYQTRVLVAQFLTTPFWQARLGLAQKILKTKGSLKFSLSDIFYTNQQGGDIRNIANSKANWLSYLDSRVATFTFSYRFSKGKALNARQSGASETEKGRIKTN